MIHSTLMSEFKQSDSGWFARMANTLVAQSVRPEIRQQNVGSFSLLQFASDLNGGSTGLHSGESLYPLRT
jgi:hypothetical protein